MSDWTLPLMNVLSPRYLIVAIRLSRLPWLIDTMQQEFIARNVCNHMIFLSEEIFVILNIVTTVVDT